MTRKLNSDSLSTQAKLTLGNVLSRSKLVRVLFESFTRFLILSHLKIGVSCQIWAYKKIKNESGNKCHYCVDLERKCCVNTLMIFFCINIVKVLLILICGSTISTPNWIHLPLWWMMKTDQRYNKDACINNADYMEDKLNSLSGWVYPKALRSFPVGSP